MLSLPRSLLLALALLSQAVFAAAPPRSQGGQPDLLLVIWDPVAQVSYTQSVLPLTTNADQFWIQAQQDAGYSFFLELDPTNPALAAFRGASTNTANQSWALFGFESSFSLSPGANKVYSTLTQGPGNGQLNPNYADMTTANYNRVLSEAFNINVSGKLYNGLAGAAVPGLSVRPNRDYFSSFDRKGSSGYFAGQTAFSARGGGADGSFLAGVYNVANSVGKSSWFYYLTNAAGSDTVAVDKFDNLGYNGYWGLAMTSSDRYLLSYTLLAANTPRASATSESGLQRVSITDYAAAAGEARLLDVSDAITAVPEPSTWGLLCLGLLGLAARARARSR